MTTLFGEELARWRKQRKLSQLALALETDVSQRHISFLETGRAKPSRDMLLRICETLCIPLRMRNQLLSMAGFAHVYRESALNTSVMQPIAQAIDCIIDNHAPYPAIVVDRFWNIIKQNQPATIWFTKLFSDPRLQAITLGTDTVNIAELSLHPQGFRHIIENWEEVHTAFKARLRNELLASGDTEVAEKLHSWLAMSESGSTKPSKSEIITSPVIPVVPLKLRIDGQVLSLFSVISTLGTPQDITTDELRIETFYPSDEKTANYFRDLLDDTQLSQ
jgi:transcriptional regulator with XRE-family HTH domain